MEYTKGNWTIVKDYGFTDIFTNPKTHICSIRNRDNPQYEANAHLIAATPEMYEALSELTKELETIANYSAIEMEYYDSDNSKILVDKARKALAKAEGK